MPHLLYTPFLYTPFRTDRFRYAGLIGTLLLWGVLPGRASLVIEASTPQSERWRAAYGQISAAWKTRRLLRVREATKREMEQLIADSSGEGDNRDGDGDIDGCFQNAGVPDEDDPATITLRDSLRGDESALVFLHEYGHYVWDNVLNGRGQRAWTRLWREQRRSHHLITPYAGDSDEEGFAEAFAYFVHKPEILRRKDARAFHFLQEAQAS